MIISLFELLFLSVRVTNVGSSITASHDVDVSESILRDQSGVR